MSETATEISMSCQIDARRRRADVMTAEIMNRLRPYLQEDSLRDAHYALLEFFHKEGIDVVTDDYRRQVGLPPRGETGWTAQELHAMEMVRLQSMLQPISMRLPDDFISSARPTAKPE
jgi:hypothetical protein